MWTKVLLSHTSWVMEYRLCCAQYLHNHRSHAKMWEKLSSIHFFYLLCLNNYTFIFRRSIFNLKRNLVIRIVLLKLQYKMRQSESLNPHIAINGSWRISLLIWNEIKVVDRFGMRKKHRNLSQSTINLGSDD